MLLVTSITSTAVIGSKGCIIPPGQRAPAAGGEAERRYARAVPRLTLLKAPAFATAPDIIGS